MNDKLTSQSAAELFVQIVVARAYDTVIANILRELKQPEAKVGHTASLAAADWCRHLDDSKRKHVEVIVEMAVRRAVFGALVVLDGAAGGYPVPGQRSEFALYLNVYDSVESERRGDAMESVRLNPPALSDDLHDLYQRLLEDRDAI